MAPPTSISVPAGGAPLRSALQAAPPGAVLRLGAGVHTGPFILMRDVTLVARDPANPPLLRGEGEGCLMPVDGRGITVALEDVVLEHGGDTNAGGLLRVANGATLLLTRVTLRQGRATGYGGGALYLRRGEATLRDCQLLDCEGRSGGALLVAQDARLVAEGCVFAGNSAAAAGAALAVRDQARVRLSRCDLRTHVRPEGDGRGWLIDEAPGPHAHKVALDACLLPS